MATRDITEGRGSATSGVGRAIAVDLGIVSSSSIWTNTDIAYDVAIGGLPFIYAYKDEQPYVRQTAPFRKEQSDTSAEPGEQSLTGWWMRSQSSFHSGTGIKFYDPQHPGQITEHDFTRFADSNNVDVWTEGQATLLKEAVNTVSTGVYKLISGVSGSTNVAIAFIPASTTLKDIAADASTLTTYATTASAIVDVCSNGTTLFVANATRIYSQTIGNTGALNAYYTTGSSNVKMGWVKQRLVAGIGTSIYELTGALGTTALPTPIYTHPNTGWVWSSISEGGSAIYAAGYAAGNSAIFKFTLSANGGMPVLSSGAVAAQLPIGEIVYKIESYLGYLMIGTNKGMRVAQILDSGDLKYGPLIFEDTNGVRDFAFRDRFVWATGTVDTYAGLYRIDLSQEIETLRFAYAKDIYLDGATGYATTVDFVGNSDQVAFTTSGSNGIVIQSATVLSPTGWLKTGKIRFGTLEPKNFKRLLGRGTFMVGDFTLASVVTDTSGNETFIDHINYNSGVPAVEVTTNSPDDAQEFLAYKFTFARDTTDTTTGPTFKGYQAKASIATPRQRLIKFPVYCFDTETDRYNAQIGYETRAWDRILLLEDLEETGDVLTFQDFSTGESRQVMIEQATFTRMTPPDKRFSGFGGIIEIIVRTV